MRSFETRGKYGVQRLGRAQQYEKKVDTMGWEDCFEGAVSISRVHFALTAQYIVPSPAILLNTKLSNQHKRWRANHRAKLIVALVYRRCHDAPR